MKVDVSIGEVVDKVSILAIKLKKMADPDKINNVQKEYNALVVPMNEAGVTVDSDEFTRLAEVNLKLWDIEDKLRLKEVTASFDEEFVELARSVYFTNDQRAAIKREINLKFGSELVEEKEYVDYQSSTSSLD